MKISDKIENITVTYVNGTQDYFVPTSEVEEFEECYEFKDSAHGKTRINVIMKSQVQKIIFTEK